MQTSDEVPVLYIDKHGHRKLDMRHEQFHDTCHHWVEMNADLHCY